MATKNLEKVVNMMQDTISEDILYPNYLTYDAKSTLSGTLEDSTLIAVKNNSFGGLTYINERNGESFVWDKTGQVNLLTIGDLRAMKQRHIAFFRNQWIVMLGVSDTEEVNVSVENIYKAVGAAAYYKNIVDITDIDTMLKWTPKQIAEKAFLLSPVAKSNVTAIINAYIRAGVIDSVSAIKSFEEALGCSFAVYSN